jgi:hypothetical protein
MGLIARATGAARQQPEEVFLSWLLSQPPDINLTSAVDTEIQRLDGYKGQHPGPLRLLELFTELRDSLKGKHPRIQ